MFCSSKHAASRLLLGVALAAAAVVVDAQPASAATPEHVTLIVTVPPLDLPAGALCDFAYHQEASYTRNRTRFFDSAGNLVRIEDLNDVTVVHRNVDTGYTLVEEDRYAAHVDFASGVVRVTGQSWALRDEAGRLVLAGAGLLTLDLSTEALLTQTSNVKDSRQIFCPALGGTPAP
jgi:uncharacterized protein (DUF2141 family)